MRKSFIVVVVLAALLAVLAVPAAAASPAPALPAALLQTPAPAANTAPASGSGVPWLAIIVLVGVAAFMVWRTTRPELNTPIQAVGCIPVIDEKAEARQKARIQELEEKEARENKGS